MYNLQQRSSNLFSFAVTVLSTILGLVAVISYIQGYSTIQGKVELDAEKTKVVARRFGPENQDYKKKSEFVRFSFDVDADFTELFHWNTKQVFVTLVAEYQTDKYVRNTVVLWDKIITEKEKAHLKLKNIGNKYAMIDISQKWNYERANLSLAWDITPYVGMLQSGHSLTKAHLILPSVE